MPIKQRHAFRKVRRPVLHQHEFRCVLRIVARGRQNLFIGCVNIPFVRIRLGNVEGCIYIGFNAISFRIVEVKRPTIAMIDLHYFGDPGFRKIGVDDAEIIERTGAEGQMIDHNKIRRPGDRAANHRNLMMRARILA
jgi:hypothetical protein